MGKTEKKTDRKTRKTKQQQKLKNQN